MNARTAVIVDVDGTLVNVDSIVHHIDNNGRRNFTAFHRASRSCPPNSQALDFCAAAHAAGHEILIVTARTYRWETLTVDWLTQHLSVPYTGPFMRGDTDLRPDTEVKRDIHRILTNDHDYRIVAAIDDNPSIIDLWQEFGIPTTIVPRDWA